MKAALLMGFLGTFLCFGIGISKFEMSILDIGWSILSANISVLIALLGYLQLDRLPPSLKKWIRGGWKAWTLVVLFYMSIFLNLVPSMRDWQLLYSMLFPLVLSTGFAMIAFGPIRDRIVWHYQRKECEEAQASRTQGKDDFRCFPSDSAVL